MSPPQSSATFAGLTQGVMIGDHNTQTLHVHNVPPALATFVLREYEPIRQAIEDWRLSEAERDLRALLDAIIKEAKEDPGTAAALRDLHQRLLLAFGLIHQRRGRRKEALAQWETARSLGPFNSERRRQAMALLANLGETQRLAETVAGCPYYEQAPDDMKAILAWLEGNEEYALGLVPVENPDLDMQLLRIRILLSRLAEGGCVVLQGFLSSAWEQAQRHPVFTAEIADLTFRLLQRIVDTGWEASGVDRLTLLADVRRRVRAAMEAWEPLQTSFPEGYLRTLALAAQFHSYLSEDEEAETYAERIRQVPVLTREKALAAFMYRRKWYDEASVAAMEADGALSPAEAALLISTLQAQSGSLAQARRTLTDAFEHEASQRERGMLAEALIKLLADGGLETEARQVLDREQESLPAEAIANLEGAILLNQGSSAAANHCRAALRRFPRSRALLENLILMLRAVLYRSTTGQASGGPADPVALRIEALACARRLAQILPSPEARFAEAHWSAETGDADGALTQMRALWQQGRRTRALALDYAYLLHQAGKAHEAAEVLEASLERYPDDYELAWQCGTAQALANNPARAIEILEPLKGRREEGVELYVNLAIAQLHAAAKEPARANEAFDLLRDALRKFPSEPTLPARIVEAAHASNRMREAHKLLDDIDLGGTPHLRRLSSDEALTLMTAVQEQAQVRRSLYEVGAVPFSFLSEQLPQPAWFVWWARLASFKQRAGTGTPSGAAVISNLAALRPSMAELRRPKRRIILDMTALLTLGSIEALAEVIDAFDAGRWKVYLFPEALNWLEQETSRLKSSQWPIERQRYSQIESLLQAARTTVAIHPQPTNAAAPPTEARLHLLGPRAFDVAEAEAKQGYYLDDYIDPEAAALLPRELLLTSRELLTHLVERGVVLSTEAERLRETMPEIFSGEMAREPIDPGRPIVVSEAALLAWQDAGILPAWAAGGIGWPPIMVGPCAYSGLHSANEEALFYRKSLDLCENTLGIVKRGLSANKICDCPAVPRLRLKIGNLGELWKPTLRVLAVASRQELVVCADDLFTRLIMDKFGLLGEEVGLRPAERQVRRRFPAVNVMDTSELLDQLASMRHIAVERSEHFQWQLFSHGYRGSSLRGVLRRLLKNVPLSSSALPVPYQSLVDALAQADTWLPPNPDVFRRNHYLRSAVAVIVRELLVELWINESKLAPLHARAALADQLLLCFESVTQGGWSLYHDAFWTLLGTQLAEQVSNQEHRKTAFEWLTGAIAAPERANQRTEIVRAIEDCLIQLLGYIPENQIGDAKLRQFASRMLVPLVEGPLSNDIDDTFRRLLGFVCRFPEDGRIRTAYELKADTGQSAHFTVSEQEEEEAILRILRDDQSAHAHPEVVFRLDTVKTTLEKAVPELGGSILLNIDAPAIHLMLSEPKEIGPPLLDYMAGSFEAVDPPLADRLRSLRPSILSENLLERREGLRRLCLAYLQSSYFELRRDLVRGVHKLRDAPVATVNALCVFPPLPDALDADSLWEAIARSSEEEKAEFPKGAGDIFFLLSETVFPNVFPTLGEIWSSYENSTNKNKVPPETVLERCCDGILYRTSPFEALAQFSILLAVGKSYPDLGVATGDAGTRLLREWIQDYIQFMLCACRECGLADQISLPFHALRPIERLRREAHALCLQCGMWIAASPQHCREWETEGADQDRIVGNWLLRGIVLAERLLPVLVGNNDDYELAYEEMNQVRERLGFSISQEAYPDAFNPFIFSLEGYDHVLAALLRLLDVTWEAILEGGTRGQPPYWWTEAIRQSLEALASGTGGEAAWLSIQNLGKVNHLKLACDRIPADYARAMLEKYEGTDAKS